MKKLFLTLLTLMVCLVANATDYYLMGVGGWNWKFDGSSEANQHKFQSNGDGTFSYTYTGTISANTGFQIAAVDNGSSSSQFRSNGNNVVLDQPYTTVFGTAGGNMSITQDVTNPTFTINPDSKILTVSTGGQIITPTPGEISWYLKSAAWNDWNDKKNFTLQSDGTYLLENVDITAESEFKAFMTTNNENEKGYRYGNNDSNYSFDAPKDEMLYEKGYNMNLNTAGKYSFTIYQDGPNWKMKTVKAGNAPEHVYVIGSIKDSKWNTSSTPAMTKNGSKFTLSNVELVNDDDKAKFTLITKLGSDWSAVNGSNRFGPSSKSDTDASTTAANMVKEYKVGTDDVGSAKNWLIAAGTYDLVFDYDALTLTITESGVTPSEPGEISWYLDDTQFTKVSDGEFTLTKQMTNGSNFHIYMQEASSSKIGYNYNSNTSHGWGINDGDDKQLYVNSNDMHMNADGNFVYTIYRDGSNWKMKVVSTIAVPDKLDLNYKYDNNWQTSVGMTKDGSKFTCTLKGVQQSKDYIFHFTNGSTCYQSTSDQNDAHYTNGDGRKLDFKIQNGDGKYDFKYYYNDSECDLTIEIDFATMKVTVLRSNYTEPVQPDNQYYLLGDVNNWMNDGTYTTNGKEYGYGYSKAENGVRADYQFIPTTLNRDSSWFVLDLSKTKTGGNLWGQFTIVQDKGVFQPAKLEENRNDGRDVINWEGDWEQWSNDYDRTSDKNNYLKETVKAYKDVPSDLAASAGVAEKVKRSNFHLDHNLYKGVKIYFNPTDQKIFMTYEDTQDFYIYLSMDADRNDNEPANKYVGIIKESMNSVNYTVNFKDFAVDSQTGTAMTLCEDEQQFPNGLVYTKYWKIKIPNGIEGPAGQKFNVNIKGSKGYRDSKYSTIFLNDLYIIDGLKAFAKAEDQTVESVQYRLYGYPADGDVSNLVIIDTNTGEEKPASEAGSEYGWVTLKYGEYSYHPYSTGWWHTGDAESIIGADFTTKTHGFHPDIKDSSTNEYYSIPAEHAMKFIQWRIIYKGSQNVQGMRKAAGEKRLVPETLTVDRSNPDADWVLNGTHKEVMAGIATGVEDIEVEDAEINEEGEAVAPVYYNLQGVRVAEPQHGLYIKVTGNKSEKILVK